MKLNNNPWAWAFLLIVLGWWLTNSGDFESFVVLSFAILVAKIIELINLNQKSDYFKDSPILKKSKTDYGQVTIDALKRANAKEENEGGGKFKKY